LRFTVQDMKAVPIQVVRCGHISRNIHIWRVREVVSVRHGLFDQLFGALPQLGDLLRFEREMLLITRSA